MNFIGTVPGVPCEEVARLVRLLLPFGPASGCYFAWREHYAAEQLRKERIGRSGPRGAVLTEHGWEIPHGPGNERIIDQAGTEVMSPEDIARQARIDAEVNGVWLDHETAVLAEDLWVFGMQWRLVTGDGLEQVARYDPRRLPRSAEREAFIRQWLG